MKKTETFLWLAFAVFVALRIFISQMLIGVLIVGMVLNIFYFAFTYLLINGLTLSSVFRPVKNLSSVRKFSSVALGVVFSLSSASIMSGVMAWPGSMFMSDMSIIFNAIVFLVIYFKRRQIDMDFKNSVQKRTLLFIVVNLILVFLLYYSDFGSKIFPPPTHV